MKTRKQLLNREITHYEYYSQFVNREVIHRVMKSIGFDRIKNSEDPAFNDIPLQEWDALSPLPYHIRKRIREAGDVPTLSGSVCIYKQAAKMIKGGKNNG